VTVGVERRSRRSIGGYQPLLRRLAAYRLAAGELGERLDAFAQCALFALVEAPPVDRRARAGALDRPPRVPGPPGWRSRS
jgi:hypothetical protein